MTYHCFYDWCFPHEHVAGMESAQAPPYEFLFASFFVLLVVIGVLLSYSKVFLYLATVVSGLIVWGNFRTASFLGGMAAVMCGLVIGTGFISHWIRVYRTPTSPVSRVVPPPGFLTSPSTPTEEGGEERSGNLDRIDDFRV